MPANPYPVPQSSRNLTSIAWGIILLISALPEILWMELSGSVPVPFWLWYARMALLFGLGLTTLVWKPLRPLRNFLIVMFIFFALAELRPKVNFTIPALQSLLGGTLFDERMQAEQTGKLAVSVLMIFTLFVLGYRRSDFFLRRGDLHTPIEPVPLLGFPKPDPWPRFGLQWGVYIAAALGILQYLGLRTNSLELLKVLPALPSILFYASLNAFNEEITYRASMLATLEPLGGSRHALWMASYFFGIAHYFGTPGGIAGGVASIFMGWILGKAMLETRGLFWAWWIHWLSDIVIFTFITLAILR